MTDYIDKEGKGHTMLILTDAESRMLRIVLADHALAEPLLAFNRGIQRATERMAQQSKDEWKARKK